MKQLEILQPQMAEYELIDCGDGAKLERFGDRIVARPEPQALWQPSLPQEEWTRLADATFVRSGRGAGDGSGDERGEWRLRPGMPDRWTMSYSHGRGSGSGGDTGGGSGGGTGGGMKLRMRLALTGFKHVGVFPEQAANWNFIYDTLNGGNPGGAGNAGGHGNPGSTGGGIGKKVLNLFAYTGGATLAARAAGADVTHVDSVRQTVSWARENATLSGLDDDPGRGSIRWIVDDALKFVRREVRRGARYEGIVLDPPAYGRGPEGEKWVLAEGLDPMLESCAKLLSPSGFLVLNLYSMGLSAIVARSAVHARFGAPEREQTGELCVTDRAGKQLPLGVFYRFSR